MTRSSSNASGSLLTWCISAFNHDRQTVQAAFLEYFARCKGVSFS